MSRRKNIKTNIREAAEYWMGCYSELEVNIDWSEAESHCWRCGCEKNLQRCHIVPHSLGGADQPDNIVLLCARCHSEGPNIFDSDSLSS